MNFEKYAGFRKFLKGIFKYPEHKFVQQINFIGFIGRLSGL